MKKGCTVIVTYFVYQIHAILAAQISKTEVKYSGAGDALWGLSPILA